MRKRNCKYTINDCIILANNRNGQCLSKNYVGAHSKLLWQCGENHMWEATLNSIQNGNTWCPYCAGKAKITIADCKNIAFLKNGECLSDICEKGTQNLLWKCNKGHTWKATYNNIKNLDRWCPYCFNQISRPQQKIHEFLTAIFPQFDILLNDTSIIKPFHLDIYIPALKLGIEYDGEYWHYSDWAIKNGSLETMARKEERCAQLKIELLRIREKNWKLNSEQELQKIIEVISSKGDI